MSESRTRNVALNTVTKVIANLAMVLLSFWSRRVFFNMLGKDLLGINSLFQDVLNVLDFTDLGFSAVLMVSMYEPIAKKDYKKIHSLLDLAKTVYRYVMLAIAVFGLCFIPILKFVKTDVPFGRLILYYLPFLLNNILSYLWAYRETYLNACQKSYKLFYADMFQTFASVITRTMLLKYTGSFMAYIVCMIAFTIIKKLSFNYVISKECPEIRYDHADPVDDETKQSIIRKSKAMVVQKLSSLGINQTDSFIVSVVLNSATWGVVSNYNLIKSAVIQVLNGLVNALIPSMGNLMNSDNYSKQLEVFLQYDYLNHWIYTGCFAMLLPLSNEVISFIFNDNMLMKTYEIFVFLLSFYIQGLLSPINVMRESSGMFERDQWVAIVACLANLVTSVIFIKMFGLPGVFYGTIISSIVFIVFRVWIYFDNYADIKDAKKYYVVIIKNIVQCMFVVGLIYALYTKVLLIPLAGLAGLIVRGIVLALAFVALFLIMNFRNPMFIALVKRFTGLFARFAGR